ncbi:MAG: hypothetical protein WA721_18995, partial [Candidatus Binataceae bacterium]
PVLSATFPAEVLGEAQRGSICAAQFLCPARFSRSVPAASALASRRQVHHEIRIDQDRKRLGRHQDALKPVALPEQADDSLLALALQFLDLPEGSLLEAAGITLRDRLLTPYLSAELVHILLLMPFWTTRG